MQKSGYAGEQFATLAVAVGGIGVGGSGVGGRGVAVGGTGVAVGGCGVGVDSGVTATTAVVEADA